VTQKAKNEKVVFPLPFHKTLKAQVSLNRARLHKRFCFVFLFFVKKIKIYFFIPNRNAILTLRRLNRRFKVFLFSFSARRTRCSPASFCSFAFPGSFLTSIFPPLLLCFLLFLNFMSYRPCLVSEKMWETIRKLMEFNNFPQPQSSIFHGHTWRYTTPEFET
jgi:hypothetical protein